MSALIQPLARKNGRTAHLKYVREARKELSLWTQQQLADFLGVSSRTIMRHEWAAGIIYDSDMRRLIDALAPKNPTLATKLAKHAGLPPPAVPGGAAQGRSTAGLTDEMVRRGIHAAADAFDVAPKKASAALKVFFDEARALGIDLAELHKRL